MCDRKSICFFYFIVRSNSTCSSYNSFFSIIFFIIIMYEHYCSVMFQFCSLSSPTFYYLSLTIYFSLSLLFVLLIYSPSSSLSLSHSLCHTYALFICFFVFNNFPLKKFILLSFPFACVPLQRSQKTTQEEELTRWIVHLELSNY